MTERKTCLKNKLVQWQNILFANENQNKTITITTPTNKLTECIEIGIIALKSSGVSECWRGTGKKTIYNAIKKDTVTSFRFDSVTITIAGQIKRNQIHCETDRVRLGDWPVEFESKITEYEKLKNTILVIE